ncbi:MAG: DUF4390 domain-containing protein [Gammaproteobacteria bacterium]
MPACIKHKSQLIVILLTLLSDIMGSRLFAAEINVNFVESDIVNGIYVVNADLYYELGEKAVEALNNGIPLTFYIEVEFEQPRKLIWNKPLIRHSHNIKLVHHSLSEQYVLTNLATKAQFSFDSLSDALLKLGKISKLPVVEEKQVTFENVLHGKIRSGLDIEALPAPMRIQAWLSSEWRISTGWIEWKIVP